MGESGVTERLNGRLGGGADNTKGPPGRPAVKGVARINKNGPRELRVLKHSYRPVPLVFPLDSVSHSTHPAER